VPRHAHNSCLPRTARRAVSSAPSQLR
jgi:hypothetical protein